MRRDQKALRRSLLVLTDSLGTLPTGAPASHRDLISETRRAMLEAYDEIERLNKALGEQTRQVKKNLNRIHHVQQNRATEREVYLRSLAEHKHAIEDLESKISTLGGWED